MSHTPPQNPWGTLLDFLAERDRYYPIFASLSSYLAIAEVVALTRTCKKLSGLYQELLPVAWNIDRDLRRFVKDPYEFRIQMGRHNALLFDEFAHQFFARETLKLKEMNVAIQDGNDLDAFIQYSLQTEGYEEDPPRFKDEVDYDHILRRKNVHGEYVSQININATDSPVDFTLLHYYNSPVTIISWNKAYAINPMFEIVDPWDQSLHDLRRSIEHSLYPGAEHWYNPYDRHEMLQCGGVLEEYLGDDGAWHEIHYCGDIKVFTSDYYNVSTKRHVGDRRTWTISFDTSKVTGPKTLDFEPQGIQFANNHVYYRHYRDHADKSMDSSYQDILMDCWIFRYYPPGTQTRITKVAELSTSSP